MEERKSPFYAFTARKRFQVFIFMKFHPSFIIIFVRSPFFLSILSENLPPIGKKENARLDGVGVEKCKGFTTEKISFFFADGGKVTHLEHAKYAK